ncbi:hypothetical protein FACS1894204_08840 [Synergistales bacterium]|nr:hypothetical protein FACS1894204_08840 [Synergistales bacterium]
MPTTQAIILFTRLPIPGQTKTRLMPRLTPLQCAALTRDMLSCVVSAIRETGRDIFVFYTPHGDAYKDEIADLKRICGPAEYRPQEGRDLGERMDNALRYALSRCGACVLIGSDIPSVKRVHIENAFSLLSERDVVIAPTEDGGYWLIGMKEPFSGVFTLRSYGTDDVFASALAALGEGGKSVGIGERLRDMDTAEDLEHYALFANALFKTHLIQVPPPSADFT